MRTDIQTDTAKTKRKFLQCLIAEEPKNGRACQSSVQNILRVLYRYYLCNYICKSFN